MSDEIVIRPARTIADYHHFTTHGRALLRRGAHLRGHGFIFDGASQRLAQGLLKPLHLGHRRRTDVDFHAGRFGNGVH